MQESEVKRIGDTQVSCETDSLDIVQFECE